MKAFNVYKNDKFLVSYASRIGAEQFVEMSSGVRFLNALKFEGYQIKHGVAPFKKKQ